MKNTAYNDKFGNGDCSVLFKTITLSEEAEGRRGGPATAARTPGLSSLWYVIKPSESTPLPWRENVFT